MIKDLSLTWITSICRKWTLTWVRKTKTHLRTMTLQRLFVIRNTSMMTIKKTRTWWRNRFLHKLRKINIKTNNKLLLSTTLPHYLFSNKLTNRQPNPISNRQWTFNHKLLKMKWLNRTINKVNWSKVKYKSRKISFRVILISLLIKQLLLTKSHYKIHINMAVKMNKSQIIPTTQPSYNPNNTTKSSKSSFSLIIWSTTNFNNNITLIRLSRKLLTIIFMTHLNLKNYNMCSLTIKDNNISDKDTRVKI